MPTSKVHHRFLYELRGDNFAVQSVIECCPRPRRLRRWDDLGEVEDIFVHLSPSALLPDALHLIGLSIKQLQGCSALFAEAPLLKLFIWCCKAEHQKIGLVLRVMRLVQAFRKGSQQKVELARIRRCQAFLCGSDS